MTRTIEFERGVLALALLALVCWVMMFLAGHDIWHDSGRPDVVQLGAHVFDVRAFLSAFYALPVLLLVLIVLSRTAVKPPLD
jgi:hypothetical protein